MQFQGFLKGIQVLKVCVFSQGVWISRNCGFRVTCCFKGLNTHLPIRTEC